MAFLLLPHSHRRCIWTPLPELINEEKYRTGRVGGSEYLLRPEQIVSWTNFADEVKSLVAPFCGTVHDFAPIVPSESFGVANEIGVQGRFVQNVLHPVGNIVKLLRLGVSFGDSQWGVHRKKDDEGEKSSRVAGRGTTLFPDIVVVENKKHHIRSLAEIKTYWAFKPHEKQTWDEFLADKLGQLARYMDDHYCRFGFYTTYQQTWFLKRVDDTDFAVSEPISASATSTVSAVSLQECILATAIRATDARGSYYEVRHGKELTAPGHTFTRSSSRIAKKERQRFSYHAICPLKNSLSKQAVFFINWFMAIHVVTPQAWTELRYSSSGLAKVPDSQGFRYSFQSFNGSTEGWEW